MIFVCLGTQKYQFNILLEELDRLKKENIVLDDIFAQCGNSDYEPKYYRYTKFMSPDEYSKAVNNSDLVISHGGTGAIIKALKAGKKVIGVPRHADRGEHSDNHQFQIVEVLSAEQYIIPVYDIDKLAAAILYAKSTKELKKFIIVGNVLEIVENFLEKLGE